MSRVQAWGITSGMLDVGDVVSAIHAPAVRAAHARFALQVLRSFFTVFFHLVIG